MMSRPRVRWSTSSVPSALRCCGSPVTRDVYAAGVQDRRRQVVLAARPDAELVDVPDAGHWAAYDRHDVVSPLLVDRLAVALEPRSAERS